MWRMLSSLRWFTRRDRPERESFAVESGLDKLFLIKSAHLEAL